MECKKECKVEGCSNGAKARGFCSRHYAQFSRYKIIDEHGVSLRDPVRVPLKFQVGVCRQDGCTGIVRTRGWCNKHYLQFRSGIIDEDGNKLRDPKFRPGRGWRSYQRGYRKVMCKDHPRADRDGYILEHRLVMEEHIGRYLGPDEVVHHINGKRDDNRIENLQLRSSRADHGHGHERIIEIYQALDLLDSLVNYGMSGSTDIKKRLQKIAKRL